MTVPAVMRKTPHRVSSCSSYATIWLMGVSPGVVKIFATLPHFLTRPAWSGSAECAGRGDGNDSDAKVQAFAAPPPAPALLPAVLRPPVDGGAGDAPPPPPSRCSRSAASAPSLPGAGELSIPPPPRARLDEGRGACPD